MTIFSACEILNILSGIYFIKVSNNVFEDSAITTFTACETPDILRVIYFIKIIIDIIKIVVPIGLIIMISFDCAKGVVANEKKVGDILKVNKNRIISAILIFCIPMLVNIVLKIIDEETSYESCWVNANSADIEKYQVLWDAEEERKRLEEEKKKQEELAKNSFFSNKITFSYEHFEYDSRMSYALLTPSSASNSKPMPLIVWLHGWDEAGSSSNVLEHSGLIDVVNTWELDNFNAYILCPHLKYRPWNDGGKKESFYGLLEEIITTYNIDRDNIALVGHSMGGAGVFHMARDRTGYYKAFVVLSALGSEGTSQFSDKRIRVYVGSYGADSQSRSFTQNTLEPILGKDKIFYFDYSTHGGVVRDAFVVDEDGNNRSDLVEWMFEK